MKDDQLKFKSQQQWEVVDMYRDIRSDTPEMFWENAISYFRWCKENPIEVKKTSYSGKDAGKPFMIELPVMYTIRGLCLHCNVMEEYLKDMRNCKETAPDWYQVVSKVLYIIHDQNMTYAALDLFNPILVGRLHNIDKEEPTAGNVIIEHTQGLPALSKNEDEVLKKLELENKLFPKQE